MSEVELDELPDGVLVAGPDRRVVALNPPAARLIGCPVDRALGLDYRAVLPLFDQAGRDWWACTDPYAGLAARTGQPERRLTLLDRAHPGGPGRELLVTSRFVRAGPGAPLDRLVVGLRGTAARERGERSRADLVSTVAHELRSPLTSVKGFTATLLAKWERFTDEQKKLMLETVNADADRVTRLLAELLDVSRIDAGRLELHRQVVAIEAVVERCFAGRVAAGERPERFVLVRESSPPEMWADLDKLHQVVGNLVENAVRHGAGTVTVTIAAREDRPGAVVTVTDEGEGIAPETLPRIFAKFWRGRPTARGGTGLGLFIVKGLVEAHGGTITAGRAPTGGAQFRFVLPAGTPSFAA